MEDNRVEEMDDGFDFSSPDDAGKTLKRLWISVDDQHKRLGIVLVSVIFYTFLSIVAPLYSAYIVDLLWEKIQAAIAGGAAFSITWTDGGKDIFFLLLIYLATGLFYIIQSFLMASFAEKLSYRLRNEVGQKLSRLPLSFFDRNKPGVILSRVTNDLDKMSEAFQTGVLKLFTSIGMIVGSLMMMFRFSILLTVIFLVFMGISLFEMCIRDRPGSAAAPTAGLHFTPELLEKIKEKGISVGFVTLHVGLGTFRPVKVDEITEHKMHAEHYEVSEETAALINRTKQQGGRVIAVGTTSCRTLESVMAKEGQMKACEGWTDIFIYPGFSFRILDGLITNFHLPESTLIMLVSAFAGYEHTMRAYRLAVQEKYRFFSFGDAMLVV